MGFETFVFGPCGHVPDYIKGFHQASRKQVGDSGDLEVLVRQGLFGISDLGCEAAAIKSGLPPCVRQPEAALWWLCSAFRGWQM